jgi:hypothetical protein
MEERSLDFFSEKNQKSSGISLVFDLGRKGRKRTLCPPKASPYNEEGFLSEIIQAKARVTDGREKRETGYLFDSRRG